VNKAPKEEVRIDTGSRYLIQKRHPGNAKQGMQNFYADKRKEDSLSQSKI